MFAFFIRSQWKNKEYAESDHFFPLDTTLPDAEKILDVKMRKYQQLALFIISIVSLASFLYYKHEYERLRYTLEYLDTFGNPPVDKDDKPHCQYGTFQRVMTPPADWTQVSSDLAVYSAFWDDQNGMKKPFVRVIAVIRKSSEPPVELKGVLWYESDKEPVDASCLFEKVEEREHGLSSEAGFHVMFILCSAKVSKTKMALLSDSVPYMIQFAISSQHYSVPVFIHEVERWKTVVGKIAMCIVPSKTPTNSLKLIEYLSYHNIIGIEKFAIYGSLLTPLTRKLLDKYGDESGIIYEEKQFSNLPNFDIPSQLARKVIELDCIYRHLDTHESIVVLPIDEYILPHDRSNLNTILKSLSTVGNKRKSVSEYHLTTQKVCIDTEHNNKKYLLLSQQARSLGIAEEKGVAILYPHLRTSTAEGSQNEQHVGTGTMVVYHFVPCPSDAAHLDTHHLPSSMKYVSMIENSLIYRKWKISR